MINLGILQQAANSVFTPPTEISLVGYVTATGVSSVSMVSGAQKYDVLFCFFSDDSTLINGNPTGFTSLYDNSNQVRGIVSYKVLTSTPDSTISGLNDSTTGSYIFAAFRGVDNTNPIDVTNTAQTGTSLMPNGGSITTATNNALMITVGHLDDDRIASSVTAPSGMTLLTAKDSSSGGSCTMVAYELQPVAGLEVIVGFGGTGDDYWVAETFSLKLN